MYDGALYFAADDGETGAELWRYDGMTATRVTDIYPGGGSSDPSYLTVFDGALYFSATDSVNGTEVWRYDGTTASLAADVWAGEGSSQPRYLTVFDGALYFSAYEPSTGAELWRYDGTTASIAANISTANDSSSPTSLAVYNGALYFSAYTFASGTELWRYDGVTASLAANVEPGSFSSAPGHLTVYDGALYFGAYSGSAWGLWRYDGTTASRVANVQVYDLAVSDSALYASAYMTASGQELWRYDGTTATLAADLRPGAQSSDPADLTSFDGALYFSASDGATGRELWRYDGAATLVADIFPGGGSSSPAYLATYDGDLYFSAAEPTSGAELWRYGSGPSSRMALAPAALDFGSVVVGGTNPPQQVTIMNVGGGTLTVTGLSLTGPDGGQFQVIRTPALPFVLSAGELRTLEVVFEPTDGGGFSAEVEVIDADGVAWTVPVTGLAEATPVATESPVALPDKVMLSPAFPNPSAAQATLRYALPAPTAVRLAVYDVLGREVAVLVDSELEAGWHEATFDGQGHSAGIYVVRLEAGGVGRAQRLTVTR